MTPTLWFYVLKHTRIRSTRDRNLAPSPINRWAPVARYRRVLLLSRAKITANFRFEKIKRKRKQLNNQVEEANQTNVKLSLFAPRGEEL